MKIHYHTENHQILCGQKHKKLISANARFSYRIGRKENCKNCDRKLLKHILNNVDTYKCSEKPYPADCQWNENGFCCCIDDCARKIKNY